MTKLGVFLSKRAINKSEVARRTGLSKARINELSLTPSAKLTGRELYIIALAIQTSPCELLDELYGDLKFVDGVVVGE